MPFSIISRSLSLSRDFLRASVASSPPLLARPPSIGIEALSPFLSSGRTLAVQPRPRDLKSFFSNSAVCYREASEASSSDSDNNNNINKDGEEALLQRLKDELKAAMKGRKADVVSILKSLLSDHQLASKTVAGTVAVSVISLIRKAIARRIEAAQQYSNAKREDLAEKEKGEVSFLERFLPSQMQAEELRKLAQQAVEAARGQGVDGKKLMGAAIKEVKAKAAGRVDGVTLKNVVEDIIKRSESK